MRFVRRRSSRTCISLAILMISCSTTAMASEVEETSQFKLQSTYVWQYKPSFSASYSGTNSLSPAAEKNYSLSATAYLGIRIWRGGELYFNPEMALSHSLSNLTGLGGFSNGEDQKNGGPNPTFYTARCFARQTMGFGGEKVAIKSAPNQLAGEVDSQRLVFTAGKVSIIDIFDNNNFSHDPRTQFLNWTFMTYGAFDYAADVRGYTKGAALEYYLNYWGFRAGRFELPIESNALPLDPRWTIHHGDQFEVEHAHEINHQPGKLHVLAFHNKANMGSYQDAVDFWNRNGRVGVPDVEKVSKEQTKSGYGIALEQNITQDDGLFIRTSRNDGTSETFSFADIERSLTGGVLAGGNSWNRPEDNFGVAYARNGISSMHQQYLANGGRGFFIGDGKINYRPENILECFYNIAVMDKVWVSLDYQHINNPAYNADRGPVHIVGTRLHLEY
jgi:high affinity Mn2+ porin